MGFLSSGDGGIDVDRVVEKIKSQYRKYAEIHGRRVFNLKAFEDRYDGALRAKVNMKAFLHAEILAVEELKKRVEEAKSPQPRKPGYGDVADGIIEKNLQRVRKYRCVDFHPDAEAETKHLLGAAADFYEKIWIRAARLISSLRIKGADLARLEGDFAYYVTPFGGSYSRAVDDYIRVLSRKNPRECERAAVNFIRFGGILLNDCLRALTDGINALQASQPGSPPLRELVRYREILRRLIEDFRLGDIRGY